MLAATASSECLLGPGKPFLFHLSSSPTSNHSPNHANPSTAFVQCQRSRGLKGLKGLMAYRRKELGYLEEIRGLRLTARKNLCQHSCVRKEGDRKRLPRLRPFQLFHTGSFTSPVLLLISVSNIPIMDLLAQINLIIWHQAP